jgi:hypothetical protein
LEPSISKWVEIGLASVDKWTQSLHEEYSVEIQGTQCDIQVTKVLVEVTHLEFRMKLAEVETQA